MAQRTYGAQGGDIESTVRIFSKCLAGYDPEKVIAAVEKWLLKSPDFPTPADIRQIIDPEPQYIATVYNRLANKCKSDPMGMSQDDWDYMRKFEMQAKKGL